MKSRLAIVAVLASGGLMSAPGTGFATPGLSGSNDASVAQYGTPAPTPAPPAPPAPATPAPNTPAPAAPAPDTPAPPAPVADAQEDRAPEVLPERESSSPAPSSNDTAPQGGVRPDTDSRESAPSGGVSPAGDSAPAGDDLQPSRQVEAGAQAGEEGQLPFTGFAAIPILIGGVALLGTGAVLRRRTRDDA